MPATGGTIIVEAFPNSGNGYVITNTIRVPSNVTIIGRGNVRITVQADVPAFQNYDTTNGNERIVISGFKIVADRSVGSSYYSSLIRFEKVKYCVVENCILEVLRPDSTSNGIYLYGDSTHIAEGNIISGCTIFGGDATGLRFGIHFVQYCQGNMITNNTVCNCKKNCQILDSSKWNVITGNIFRNYASGGTYGGLYVQSSDFNVITCNECNSNIRGIYLYNSNGCTVQGNICNSNSSVGILVTGASAGSLAQYNVVSGNVCNSNGLAGIDIVQYTKFTTINGNNANGNSSYGIYEASGVGNDYNISVGNVCSSNASQISLSGQHSLSPDNMVS